MKKLWGLALLGALLLGLTACGDIGLISGGDGPAAVYMDDDAGGEEDVPGEAEDLPEEPKDPPVSDASDDAAGDGAEQNCRGHNRNECKPDFQIPQGDGKKTGEHNICGHHHGKNGKTVGGTDTAFIHTAYLLWICAEAAFLQQKTPLLSFCDANTIKKRLAVR